MMMTHKEALTTIKAAAYDAAMRSMAPDTARATIAGVRWFAAHCNEVGDITQAEVLAVFTQAFRERLADLLEGDAEEQE